jgi:predicted kinase
VNKLKIWVLQGIQGSGKSTVAQKIFKENKNTYRVNKDLLRANLYFEDFNPRYEKVIAEANNALVEQLLKDGRNVISDNMNLSERDINFYRGLAEKYNADLEIIKMEITVDECVRRDAERKQRGERAVGKDAILNTAFRYKLIKQEKPIAAFDLDGTLSCCEHRRKYTNKENGNKPNWPKFFEEAINDPPRKDIIAKMHEHKAEGCEIVISSACPEDYREMRTRWLLLHGAVWDRFLMRPKANYAPDVEIKQYFIDNYLDKSKIKIWYDDRVSVVELLKKNGINVVNVGDGTFQ